MTGLRYTNETLLADIRRVAKLNNKNTVSIREYALDGKYNRKTYIKRFTSWTNAVTLAGLTPNYFFQLNENAITHKRVSVSLRYNVFKRDHFRCVICGRSPAKDISVELHCDHIKPISRGGESTMENLRTLCAECNIGKGANL